jgi:protein-S-isoprenylcysteine O-methyltransferase Ste14
MNKMKYRIVFDVVRDGYSAWSMVLVGLLFVFVGVGLVAFRHRLRGRHVVFVQVVAPFALLASAVLWTGIVVVFTLKDYWSLRDDLSRGRCEVTEGVVSGFVPSRIGQGRSTFESFTVGSEHFSYSDFNIVAGFHRTSFYGGPIRAGLQVRIHHRNREIARLEIAE